MQLSELPLALFSTFFGMSTSAAQAAPAAARGQKAAPQQENKIWSTAKTVFMYWAVA